MSYDKEERMERMRKENEESLGRIHRSSESLSVRIENIEQRREVRSSNSSHGEDEGYEEDEGRWRNERYKERRIHRRYGGRQREEGIEGEKVKIPTFKGTCDPEVYLEWEMKVEQVFACYNYNEEKKIKLAFLEFEGYALVWLNQMRSDVERMKRPLINTWQDMKRVLRERFVPSYYGRDLHNKLQRLIQGNMSVDEYYKEMEISLIRAQIEESQEATMARFLHGLNREIQDIVELHHYASLEDIIHQAIKAEQQLKRKQTYKKSPCGSSTWTDKETFKKDGRSSFKSHEKGVALGKNNSNPTPTLSKVSSIKCFKCLGKGHIASQCPNKRTMVVLGNGDITSASSSSSSSSSSESESKCDVQPLEGDLLMVRRLMGNVWVVAASQRLIEKLALKTSPHPRPYKIQWLSENGELVVDRQVLIYFSIGKYVDEIMFDVVPMEASHLLLGRPWQYDRDVVHNGVTNKFSFVHKGQKVTLKPLSPSEVKEEKVQKATDDSLSEVSLTSTRGQILPKKEGMIDDYPRRKSLA
ncbi:uncharacterized protein [Glycine max]|uniref:uncharacterized protein n=1 Tax=Glycine max TaxID=3847 RepID=UPI0003DE72DC|nr:uncharacterized protein LOC100809438 [Glycine max]|eukprot:XP_006575997.1 uncharacterized protein LOC100809438 [Glycine max]